MTTPNHYPKNKSTPRFRIAKKKGVSRLGTLELNYGRTLKHPHAPKDRKS